MNTIHVKKGDEVKIIAGSHKGKTGSVVRVSAREQLVYVDGINVIKRKVKPSQLNPRGGTKEIHVGLAAGKVALATNAKSDKPAKKPAKKAVTKKAGKENK